MNESDFEGSLVLEKLAEIDKLEDFFDAVDADDFVRAKKLMRMAGMDDEEISKVLEMMEG